MKDRTHWIFDLDGTLTVAVHDYAQMRARLGLPEGQPILESIAALEPAQQAQAQTALDALELRYADDAQVAPGADALLTLLRARGHTVGILTRNCRHIALRTLDVIGLRHHFDADHILGRAEAPFKPSPAGILRLLAMWSATPASTVMVGDSHHDLGAAENADVLALLVHAAPPTDHVVRAHRSFPDLLALAAELA